MKILQNEKHSLYNLQHKVPLLELTENLVEELQTALLRLGYPVGPVDGLVGPKTRNAWAEFKHDNFQGNLDYVGPGSLGILKERVDELRDGRIHDFSSEVGTIAAILWECDRLGLTLPAQKAYVLATVKWETAHTFKPVRESYWLDQKHGFAYAESWRRLNFRYYPYYGRGFVQLTWRTNYQKYSDILGVNLVSDPDKAMEPNVSLFILVHGFVNGTFTGRGISRYINTQKVDFRNARRCINGMDRADEIAAIANSYLKSGLVS